MNITRQHGVAFIQMGPNPRMPVVTPPIRLAPSAHMAGTSRPRTQGRARQYGGRMMFRQNAVEVAAAASWMSVTVLVAAESLALVAPAEPIRSLLLTIAATATIVGVVNARRHSIAALIELGERCGQRRHLRVVPAFGNSPQR